MTYFHCASTPFLIIIIIICAAHGHLSQAKAARQYSISCVNGAYDGWFAFEESAPGDF
jgi:hypothetical protein